jgi:tetratricopeptide (TPR) repeat protein
MESDVEIFAPYVPVHDFKIRADDETRRINRANLTEANIPEKISADIQLVRETRDKIRIALIFQDRVHKEICIRTNANSGYSGDRLFEALSSHSSEIINGGNVSNTISRLIGRFNARAIDTGMKRYSVHIDIGGKTVKITNPFPADISSYHEFHKEINDADIVLTEVLLSRFFEEPRSGKTPQYMLNLTNSRRMEGGEIAILRGGNAPMIAQNDNEESAFLTGAINAIHVQRGNIPSNPLKEDLSPFENGHLHSSIIQLLQYYGALHNRLMYNNGREQTQRFDMSISTGSRGGMIRMNELLFYSSVPPDETMEKIISPIHKQYPKMTSMDIKDSAATGDRFTAIHCMAAAMSVPHMPSIQSDNMGRWLRQFVPQGEDVARSRTFMDIAEGVFWTALQSVESGIVYHSITNTTEHISREYENEIMALVAKDAIKAAHELYMKDMKNPDPIYTTLPTLGIEISVMRQNYSTPTGFPHFDVISKQVSDSVAEELISPVNKKTGKLESKYPSAMRPTDGLSNDDILFSSAFRMYKDYKNERSLQEAIETLDRINAPTPWSLNLNGQCHWALHFSELALEYFSSALNLGLKMREEGYPHKQHEKLLEVIKEANTMRQKILKQIGQEHDVQFQPPGDDDQLDYYI